MAILLIPGFMLDADLWRDVEIGLSEFAPFYHADLGQDGTIEAMAKRALEHLPERFILVGFSMGGYVARKLVRLVPERVQALILIATSARGNSVNLEARRAAADNKVTAASFNGMSRISIVRSLHPDHADDDSLINRIRDMNKRLGAKAFVLQSNIIREDERDKLFTINCPTLVIAASHDALRSEEEAKEMQEKIPFAKMEVIDGAGHMIPMEAPETLSETIKNWLHRDCKIVA